MMINWLIERDVDFIVVLTKTDKLSKAQLAAAVEELSSGVFKGTGIPLIPFSSVTREGKDEVWKKIDAAISR
jgi:GTP-binding protein